MRQIQKWLTVFGQIARFDLTENADVASVALAFIVLTLAFFIAGLTYWGWLMVGVSVLVGLMELMAVKRTGRTLSRQFGELLGKRRTTGLILLLLLSLAYFGLVLHLLSMAH